MKLFFLTTLFSLNLFLGAQTISEPANLGKLKNVIANYIESGSYQADIAGVYADVQLFVDDYMKTHGEKGGKFAIVMDIDETTLSNKIYENRFTFGFSNKTWKQWIVEEKAVAIPAAKAFYDWGRSRGLTFFFVTGRHPSGKSGEPDHTVRNLEAQGFDQYGKVYLKPHVKGLKTVAYKSGARKEIMEQGYVIIANIGDQTSDLTGGYAVSTWKIPNPMYFVP